MRTYLRSNQVSGFYQRMFEIKQNVFSKEAQKVRAMREKYKPFVQ